MKENKKKLTQISWKKKSWRGKGENNNGFLIALSILSLSFGFFNLFASRPIDVGAFSFGI